MKLFGSLTEYIKSVFEKDGQSITLQPDSGTTFTADQTLNLPPPDGDNSDTLVSEDASQTLTNKTIDGDDNTVQDLPDTALKTEAGQSDRFFTRNGSGVPESATKAVPTGDVIGSSDTQTLTNKTIDGDNNTISNLAHGAEVDNPSSGVHGVTGAVVGTTDSQTLTNKTLTSPTIGTDATYSNQAATKWAEQTGNGSNYIAFTAPDAVTTDTTFKLPDGSGSAGQVLTTDGVASTPTLSWSTVAGGGSADPYTTTDSTSVSKTIASGDSAYRVNLTLSGSATWTFAGTGLVDGTVDAGTGTIDVTTGSLTVREF